MNRMAQDFHVVGRKKPDLSGVEKVTGSAKFISDVSVSGMLIGRVLHSPHAHARIIRIDESAALRLPGVLAVVTARDVPRKRYTGEIIAYQNLYGISESGVFDAKVLDDKVRYVGDPVAAVAALNEKVAEEALELIRVEYEPLPAIFDEREAIREGAPAIHDRVWRKQSDGYPGEEPVSRNLGLHVAHRPIGDVNKGFEEADFVVEETAYTSRQRHATLETWHCVSHFDASGRLTVWTPSQLPLLIKKVIAEIFDLPVGMVRVKGEYVGGSFGAAHCMFREPLCVALSIKSGRPVKLVYTRPEEFMDRHTRECFGPFTLKVGVKKDGTITAIERRAVSRAGAYMECAALSFLVSTGAANPLYRRPNYRSEADVIYTNQVPVGAMRGFGNPEDTFVREQVMDEAAEKLGMDPLEFRLKNLCRVGDPGFFGPAFPITSNGLAECIRMGAEKIGWKENHGRKQAGIRRRGVGVSCCSHVSGPWPVHVQTSSADIKFNEDASIVLTLSTPPFGTNAFVSLAQVAAEVLGIDYEDVRVVWGDTDITRWETGSYGSRVMYIVGNAVQKAAMEARGKLLARAARKLKTAPEDLDIRNKTVYVKTSPHIQIPLAEITREGIYSVNDVEQITGGCAYSPSTCPPSYEALFTELEVDTETGTVKILRMEVVNDCGRAINPMIVEGQIEGGTVQGMGYVLWENPVVEADTGRLLTTDFDTYKIASSMDVPDIHITLLEQPDPTGPFGAKGAGEISCVNQAASVANAIYDAIGVRIWDLPITPEKILKALKGDAPVKSPAD
jgi:xanthine dehydrogenase molybdenum-binding subunit